MQIILFTKSFAGCSATEVGEAVKSAGFDGIDLPIRSGQCVTPAGVLDELPRAKKLWEEMGLSVPLATLEGHHTDPQSEEIETIFRACAQAGIPFIKPGYWYWRPGQNFQQGLEQVRRDWEGFEKLGEKHGVCSLLHIHSGDFYGSNTAGAMQLVQGMDSRHVAIYLDPAHLAADGESTPLAVAIAGEYLKMLGIKNMRYEQNSSGGWMKKWCPLREGLVNWAQAMSTLQASGYNGPLSLHPEYDAPEGHPTPRLNKDEMMPIATEDLKYLRALISPEGA